MTIAGPTPNTDPTRPLAEGEEALGRATIGRYEIRRVLGRGGMGVVVAAHDPELDRMVAVKILVEHGARADRLGTALRREAQALARVTHPNVLSVFDAGVDGSPFLVMQLIDGETLGAHIARMRPSAPQIVRLFLQAAQGLAAIHAAGLIHRDVKPSNILVDKDGVVHVADLGLARIGELAMGEGGATGATVTRTNTIAGTPAYMAPEQFEWTELTPACDQFSFCVALWEALFGSRPFRGTDEKDLVRNMRETTPPVVSATGISRRQIDALHRGLSAAPAARFSTISALAEALAVRSRSPWIAAAAGGIAAAGAIGAVLYLGTASETPSVMSMNPPPPPPSAPATLELNDAHRLTLTDACDEYPSISVDGTIYYDLVVGPDNHLMAFDPGSRTPRELTTTHGWDLAPMPSPDGTQLAFLRKTDEMMALHVAGIHDLEHARRFIVGGFRPAWSPDGKFVWAGSRKGLFRLAADTGKVDRQLALPDGAMPMAAIELSDHRMVLLTKNGSANADGLAFYDSLDAKPRWLLPASEDNPMDEVLALAPGGEAALVGRYTVTSKIEIWRIPFDGSPGVVVSSAAIPARKRLAVSGKRLVWSDCTEYLNLSSLTLTASGATKFVDLARNEWQDFSPTSIPGTDDVLLLSYRSQDDQIWRMSKTGDRARVIPFGKLELDRISISHDGAWIAGANNDGLFAGPMDGSIEPINIAPANSTEINATFSRDNSRIYYESHEGKLDRVATVARTGGASTWLLPAPSVAPAQSPTADIVAYLAEQPNTVAMRVIMLFDTATKKSRPLSSTLEPYPYRDLRWSPDGKRLLAIRRDGRLTELDVATGKILRTFEMGSDQLFGATYAGDDILIGRSSSAGDLWEAELR